jgi:hypothetical protein
MPDGFQVWTLRRPLHNPNLFLWAPIRNMAICVCRFIVLLIYPPARHVSLRKRKHDMYRSILPFIWCNGPTPSREKHPQTLKLPAPSFSWQNVPYIQGVAHTVFIGTKQVVIRFITLEHARPLLGCPIAMFASKLKSGFLVFPKNH